MREHYIRLSVLASLLELLLASSGQPSEAAAASDTSSVAGLLAAMMLFCCVSCYVINSKSIHAYLDGISAPPTARRSPV